MARGGHGFRGKVGPEESGRGRGRGGGRHRGNGRGIPGSSFMEDELSFSTRMFADAPNGGGNAMPRGRGRGGRGSQLSGPNSGTTTPNRGRGRGVGSPRGRGRGDSYAGSRRGDAGIGSPRGRGGGRRRPDTLSGLLYQERPFLRPIVFVPSVFTKVLFQEEEELLKPGVEEVDDTEQSHIPTAERVFRVFSSHNVPPMESEDDEEKEEIEEIDFNDIEKLIKPSDEAKTTTTVRRSKLAETTTVEHQFTGFYVDLGSVLSHSANAIPSDADVDDIAKMIDETLSTTDEQPMADVVTSPLPSEILASAVHSANDNIFVDNQPDLFYVDVKPAQIPTEKAPSLGLPPAALLDDDDDDIIVYVAPHPRTGGAQYEEMNHLSQEKATSNVDTPDTSHFSPYVPAALPHIASAATSTSTVTTPVPAPPFSSVSFSFSQSISTSTTATPSKGAARLTLPPVTTPRQAKAWKKKRGPTSKLLKKRGYKSSFGAFGAIHAEEMLHPRSDPRRDERRRGDSDLEWGDEDGDEDSAAFEDVDEIQEGLMVWTGKGKEMDINKENDGRAKGKAKASNNGGDIEIDVHGMDVDPDLSPDMDVMKRFVGGLLGSGAGQHVTMEDVRIAEVMRMEDEESHGSDDEDGESSSADEEEEDVLAVEEAMLISESLEFDDDLKVEGVDSDEDDEDEDSDDDDQDQTPRTSFQARLERLRNRARSNKVADTSADDMDDEGSEDDQKYLIKEHMTWAEEDEDFIQEIHNMLDENEDILTGRDRKQKNALFRSVRNGSFEDVKEQFMRRKDKGKGLPAELQAQWEKDRQSKAEYKRARQLARLEAAADPLSRNKGGKKGRKAMLAAAKLDPTITVIPNRIIDMSTLVQQIRRFIGEVGGPSTMSLPPTNKETRKNIHEMAVAFNLKSLSKGKGDSRYTTLAKTTRSGVGVDERKVAKIVRRSGGMGARGDSFVYDKKGRGPPAAMPRHKEGEEVGKAAPKLTESNIGFRMLAMMGWSDGNRIGFTGGLDAPLTAIIKHTKLGLGATK